MRSVIFAAALLLAVASQASCAETRIVSYDGAWAKLADGAPDLGVERGDIVKFTLDGAEYSAPVSDTALDADDDRPAVVIVGDAVYISVRGAPKGSLEGASVAIDVTDRGAMKYSHMFHELARIYAPDEVKSYPPRAASRAADGSNEKTDADASVNAYVNSDASASADTDASISSDASEPGGADLAARVSEDVSDMPMRSLEHLPGASVGAAIAGDVVSYTPSIMYEPEHQYRVVRGDCLWRISRRTYGAGAHWPFIFEANIDKIDDPDLIFIDQELLLPSLPTPQR